VTKAVDSNHLLSHCDTELPRSQAFTHLLKYLTCTRSASPLWARVFRHEALHGALSWRAWQNQLGKKTRQLNPQPPQAARRGRLGSRWGHVPKAQGLERRSWGLWPCNREGARGGLQTDKQTFHAF